MLVRDPAGKAVAVEGIATEITGRKRHDEAVAAAREHMRRVIENARDAFVEIDAGDRVTSWNPAAEQLFGFSAGEALGQPLSELIIPHDLRTAHREGLARFLATGKAEVFNRHIEIRALHKGGGVLPVELSIVPLRQDGLYTFYAFIRDLSERDRAREALEESAAQLRQSLMGTIQVIARAVEERDPYTAGHQQRVSWLSRAIAQNLGLERSVVEGVRLGATIHDIGKIHLPAEILSKPGRLSEAEYDLIKTHPESGYSILRDVSFPWPVRDIAYQHHERMDGSGYPQGLRGEAICLEARIIAVADVVEAMSSDRPYRPGLGIEVALAEIQTNRGRLYDPECVDACLRLFNELGFSFENGGVIGREMP
ncbi:MAG: hypothetical protein B0D96_12175 [Candidatus Sedimenticola endophacoides]|uniref:PAS domain S-box protein n=1 Tax=Candidatus Sedimenticola endophacoides TaxID=2548426 RepID=A0A6N4E4W0_9GAMM|nr:MAG: hypothetical protein B0D94_01140 [Candidatus Sedimenticola endophacoides]OQX33142.1 MAG: hypothetical protein B0D96_12175 [Candidatus Sedimenticola endophacoides]OQX42493.1 MAG: hypothetical protein B0D89_01160 [Candidatus Sedimenticola endophacoides]OQX44359.1 MAG: hypothetical protein B0D88_02615 [Candidatus Sedimenticola endophacoides]PUD98665.1 MAG: PAS domain S-box protein [Candidatus Sedimenticola endophacoides]